MALAQASHFKPTHLSFSSLFHLFQFSTKVKRISCSPLSTSARNESSMVSIKCARLPREEKEKLMAGVSKDHLESTTRVLEQALLASEQWSVVHTDFFTPTAQEDAILVLSRLADVAYATSGGYPQAERRRLSIGSKEALDASYPNGGRRGRRGGEGEGEGDDSDDGGRGAGEGFPGVVSAINVQGKFSYDDASHGDFLGSILGTGIVREKVGDILLQADNGAYVFVVPELVEYLKTSLTKVRNTPVVVDEIPISNIRIQPQKVNVFRSVEASLRIDALASAGFRISRTKFSDLISKGDVRVNWKEISKSGVNLKQGDMVSVRGKGRLQIGEISITKKGRYAVELTRYI